MQRRAAGRSGGRRAHSGRGRRGGLVGKEGEGPIRVLGARRGLRARARVAGL